MRLEAWQHERYQLLNLIGRGGDGDVYQAYDKGLKRKVAIKIVQINDDKKYLLFKREAEIIAQLEHEHILPLYDFGEQHSENKEKKQLLGYLVMPYREEGSLEDWLRRHNRKSLSLQEVEFLIDQMAQALQYAHKRKVKHRDIKPSNFLIRRSTTDLNLLHLELADFGIAKMNSESPTDLRCTVEYTAPEQWDGNPPSPKADQYALAVTAYKLITGNVPFHGPNIFDFMRQHKNDEPLAPSKLNPTLNQEVDKVILRALEKDPAKRFSSVSTFAEALKKAANKEMVVVLSKASETIPSSPEAQPPIFIPPNVEHITGPTLPPVSFKSDQEPKQATRSSSENRRPHIVTTALIALALVLILSGGIYGVFTWKTNLDNTNATATAGANFVTNTAFAKATTHANFTATANVQTTANAITIHDVTATALANTSQYPFSYTPHQFQLRDVFPNLFKQLTNNDNWDNNDQCKLISVGYLVMSSSSNQATTCFAGNTKFTNFTYELHFQIIKGDCAGIIFRASSDEKNFYSFMICQDGSYMFVSNVNGSLIKPSRTGTSLAIAKGLNSYNTIGVEARGIQLSFYIYQGVHSPPVFLFSVPDNKYSQGSIGVIVNSLHNKPTQVLFLGTKVWTL